MAGPGERHRPLEPGRPGPAGPHPAVPPSRHQRQSLAGLQANLAAIQAPPLSAADQRQGLPAIKADLLAQLKAQERPSGAPSGPPVPRAALIKDSLRVLLLSLALAMGFAVGARRRSLAEVGPAEPVGVAGAVVPG